MYLVTAENELTRQYSMLSDALASAMEIAALIALTDKNGGSVEVRKTVGPDHLPATAELAFRIDAQAPCSWNSLPSFTIVNGMGT